MNIKYLLLGVVVVVLCGSGLIFIKSENNVSKYHTRNSFSKFEINGIQGASEWLNARRVNHKTGRIDLADMENAMAQAKSFRNDSKASDMQWSELGPDNIGGRTRAILIDKDNTNLIFAGSVSGGLWKSTTGGSSWVQVPLSGDANSTGIDGNDIISNLAISSMCQTTNGDIYVGTGEWFYHPEGKIGGGIWGQGIWKSTNHGASFTKISSTWSDADSKQTFIAVNKLAADPTDPNKIYAATFQGLRITTNAGSTWDNPIPSEGNNIAEDVKVGKNGVVVVSIIGVSSNHYAYILDNGTYVKRIVATGAGRQEFAISAQDDNYIYCLISKPYDAGTLGIYRSTDKGVTWVSIGSQGAGFNILGTQGSYDNVIAVYPNNKEKVICGGQLNLWTYSSTNGWSAISNWAVPELSSTYVHADQHAITFHPTNPDILYVGTDGGISKSNDGGVSFITLNKQYNVTQFYAVGFSGDGRLIGGTQDNGTQYTDFSQNTHKAFWEVKGGDGGYCEMSTLIPDATFATTYYGSLGRSDVPGSFIEDGYGPVTTDVAAFVTPIALWESYNDSLSGDSVKFKADRNYSAGELIHAKSKMNLRDLTFTLAAPLLKDSTIYVQDKFQSVLAIAMNNRVWITRKALDFTVAPAPWYPISANSNPARGMVNTLAFSKDGNYIYFATDYHLYRCSNLNYSRSAKQMNADTTAGLCKIVTQKIQSFNMAWGFITSITVDPNNSENVVVTLGGFNNTGGKVWYSTNAATSTSTDNNFTSKDNFLFPIYSSLVLWNDSKKVVIGSEYGIYSTDDITAATPVWSDQNNTMGNVPVFMLRQQIIPNNYITGVQNHGVIYAATHGRGLWKCESNKGPVGVEKSQIAAVELSNVMVYPNPAHMNTHIALELSKAADVTLNIYDIQGKLVKTLTLRNQGEGKHSYPINISELGKGNYILNAISRDNKVVSKFLVY